MGAFQEITSELLTQLERWLEVTATDLKAFRAQHENEINILFCKLIKTAKKLIS